MLSCLLLGLGNGYWIDHLSAFEQIHTVDFYPHLPEELNKKYEPKFLAHIIHLMLDVKYQYTNLDMVPNDEVGYVFSWDFCPYFTVPQLEKMFTQINDKLIKGGRGLIHFSNADNKSDLELINCERMIRLESVRCHRCGRLLRPLILIAITVEISKQVQYCMF